MDNKLIIWMTGLSGSGKSTLAKGLQLHFSHRKIRSFILDGDVLRKGINSDLDFSRAGRRENARRVCEIAALFADAGIVPIVAVISPYKEDRNHIRIRLREYSYMEIYVKCPVNICEERDPKGLYKKARANEITNFTGISDVFEAPEDPDIVIDTELDDYARSIHKLCQFIPHLHPVLQA
jgi:adenylylsulfate kinase